MKRRIVIPALIVAALTASAALAQWKPFTSAPGRFMVQFPGAPQQKTQDIPTAAGKVAMHMFSAGSGDRGYMVTYADYPPAAVSKSDPAKMLDGARDGAVKNSGGSLKAEKKMTIAGYPGRELKVEAKGLLLTQRMFLVKNRLYQAVAIVATKDAGSPDVNKFLDSFKIQK